MSPLEALHILDDYQREYEFDDALEVLDSTRYLSSLELEDIIALMQTVDLAGDAVHPALELIARTDLQGLSLERALLALMDRKTPRALDFVVRYGRAIAAPTHAFREKLLTTISSSARWWSLPWWRARFFLSGLNNIRSCG